MNDKAFRAHRGAGKRAMKMAGAAPGCILILYFFGCRPHCESRARERMLPY